MPLIRLSLLVRKPDLVFRDCDTIYQKLFGWSDMPVRDGCYNYTASARGRMEEGVHCACRNADNCNTGNITWPLPATTTTTAAPPSGK